MKLRLAIVVPAMLAVLVLCYLAAGTPAITLLFKFSVIGQGIALKPITYHWANRIDRTTPVSELLASRFYVLILAAISVVAGGLTIFGKRNDKRFAFALCWAIALLAIMLYAQVRAYYTFG